MRREKVSLWINHRFVLAQGERQMPDNIYAGSMGTYFDTPRCLEGITFKYTICVTLSTDWLLWSFFAFLLGSIGSRKGEIERLCTCTARARVHSGFM